MTVTKLNDVRALITLDGITRLVDVSDISVDDEEKIRERFARALERPEPMTLAAVSPAVKARREKMIRIGEESVNSRNRVFPNMPHVQASRKNQAYDGLIALLLRGRIRQTDEIIVRHLKTGEYDKMTVGDLLDEIGDMYLLQLELRKHDQNYRDKVNAIFSDSNLPNDEKARQIEALEVPEFLDVDEQSKQAVMRRSNGRAK